MSPVGKKHATLGANVLSEPGRASPATPSQGGRVAEASGAVVAATPGGVSDGARTPVEMSCLAPLSGPSQSPTPMNEEPLSPTTTAGPQRSPTPMGDLQPSPSPKAPQQASPAFSRRPPQSGEQSLGQGVDLSCPRCKRCGDALDPNDDDTSTKKCEHKTCWNLYKVRNRRSKDPAHRAFFEAQDPDAQQDWYRKHRKATQGKGAKRMVDITHEHEERTTAGERDQEEDLYIPFDMWRRRQPGTEKQKQDAWDALLLSGHPKRSASERRQGALCSCQSPQSRAPSLRHLGVGGNPGLTIPISPKTPEARADTSNLVSSVV